MIWSTSRPFCRAVVACAATPERRSRRSGVGFSRSGLSITETATRPRNWSGVTSGTRIDATAPIEADNSRRTGPPESASMNIGSGRGSLSSRSSGPPGLGARRHSPRSSGRFRPGWVVALRTSSPCSGCQRYTPARSQSTTAGHRVDEPRRDLVAGAGVRERSGELEQGAGLSVALLCVHQRGRAVQGAGGISGVDLQQLAFLSKEATAGFMSASRRP